MQPGGAGLVPWTATTLPNSVTTAYSVSSTTSEAASRPGRISPASAAADEPARKTAEASSCYFSCADPACPARAGDVEPALEADRCHSLPLSLKARSVRPPASLQRQCRQDHPLGTVRAGVEDQLGLAGAGLADRLPVEPEVGQRGAGSAGGELVAEGVGLARGERRAAARDRPAAAALVAPARAPASASFSAR